MRDTEEDESQPKKSKTRDKKEHESQPKTSKTQDAEEDKSQAKDWGEIFWFNVLRVVVDTELATGTKRNEMEGHYSAEMIIMSMNRLEEAEIVQEFHPDGSGSLFLRHPERLRRKPEPGLAKKQEFKTKVPHTVNLNTERFQDWWKKSAGILRGVDREVLGETCGKSRTTRQQWWWSEHVNNALKRTKEIKKEWEQSGTRQNKLEYRRAKKLAGKAVAVAKAEACRDLLEKLQTPGGEKRTCRIPRSRNKPIKDVNHAKQMKDATGVVLTDMKKVQAT
ncbi:hypothetical protein O3P69_012390 [Scylla paramamosain]|uniref:Uncharacterized protein n=1 Tax=Scylla paramamosain TaxID=85552 RepID=A0AAW0SFS9_SCYPA